MKPSVDFYILQDKTPQARLALACQLIEKAYKEKQRIYVHAPSQAIAHEIDELLWTYKNTSFVPHSLFDEKVEPAPPVQIGYKDIPTKGHSLLVNLCDMFPTAFQYYRRIIEIIANDEEQQQLGRERYKQYRTHTCELFTHK